MYARLKSEINYKIKPINEELCEILPEGEKKINFTDKWTTIITLRSNEYKQIKNIKAAQIDPMHIERLGNSVYEFDLIKELSNKGIIVWRNKKKGLIFLLVKIFKIGSILKLVLFFQLNTG